MSVSETVMTEAYILPQHHKRLSHTYTKLPVVNHRIIRLRINPRRSRQASIDTLSVCWILNAQRIRQHLNVCCFCQEVKKTFWSSIDSFFILSSFNMANQNLFRGGWFQDRPSNAKIETMADIWVKFGQILMNHVWNGLFNWIFIKYILFLNVTFDILYISVLWGWWRT